MIIMNTFLTFFDLQEMAPMKTWGGTQRGTSRREQNLISLLCEMKMKSSSPVVRPAEAGRGSPRMLSSSSYDRQPAGVFPPSVRFRLNNSELFQARGSLQLRLPFHAQPGRDGRGEVRTTSVDLVSRTAFCALVSERFCFFFFSR